MRKIKTSLLVLLSVIGIVFAGTGLKDFSPLKNTSNVTTYAETETRSNIDIKSIPEYSGTPYVVINGGKPSFSEKDKERVEEYSELDKYGRCGTAFANVSKELMPTKPRESIREVRPSGWHTVKYEKIIEDRYLYNRCHLIAYKLAGENANEKNLITGTRYFNVEGMLPFEDEVADYVNATGNHVLYRGRPIFNVYCYNVQPGIRINYKDGSSQPESEVVANKNKQSKKKNDRKSKKSKKVVADNGVKVGVHYIANTNTKKFHLSTCRSVKLMKAKNMYKSDNRKELIDSGYVPCKICRP